MGLYDTHYKLPLLQLTENETAWITAHPGITLGTEKRWAPYVIPNDNGTISGIEADLISDINAMTGLNITIVLGNWLDMVEKAEKREIDGLLISAYHREREADFLFTSSIYSTYKYVYTIAKQDALVSEMKDLQGKRIAYMKGNRAEEKLLQQYPYIKAIPVETPYDLFTFLREGKVDAFIGNIGFRHIIMEKMLPDIETAFMIPGSEVPILYSIRKDWPELVSIMNKAIENFPIDRKLEIIERWTGKKGINNRLIRSFLKEEEKSWLAAHPIIRVGIDPAWAPVEYVDKNGKFRGISADYLDRIGGILNVKFEPAVDLTWLEALAEARAGKLEMFSSIRKTKKRALFLDFTKPYISMPIVIFTNPDIRYVGKMSDLADRNVAVVRGYAVHEILENSHPEIQLVMCDSTQEALLRLNSGKVDAYIDNILTTTYYINHLGLTRIKVAGKTPYSYDQTMAVTRQNAVLGSILQKALDAIPENEHNAIYQRWVSVQHEKWFDYPLLWKILFVAFIIIAGILYLNRRLSIEVRNRKLDLNASNALLAESEERYRQMFLNSTAIKLLINPDDGSILDVNEAACKFYQYSRDRMMALNINDINMLSFEKITEEMQKAKLEERDYFNFKHRLANGEIKDVEVYSGPISINGTTYLLSIIHDVSVRKELEAKLFQVRKMEAIGTLAGGIAHDFNNILSIMLGYTEIALFETDQHSTLHMELENILRAGKRAKELIHQILAFSRQSEKEMKPVKPHLLVREGLKLLRATLPSTIEIRKNVKDCGTILGDHTELHQVIINLCTNAYHAMRETGGILEVHLESVVLTDNESPHFPINLPPGKYIRLSVSDTGAGISKENLSKIFDPYFTTKEKGEGTGLGLSIVHGIIKSYGGDIEVVSDIGQGTTFNVYLPDIETESEITPGEGREPLPEGNRERILLVDDEEQIAQLSDAMLKNLGYNVEVLTDSTEALKTFQCRPSDYDLVITDMTMPKMTGAELTQKMLDIRPDIPVILYTGFSELIDEKKAREIGVKAFITKPVLIKHLARTIKRVLEDTDPA